MMSLRARVRNGRLVLDEPTELPEGTELELVPIDAWDDLSDDQRRALHGALARSEDDVQQGRCLDAEQVLKQIRRKR